MKKLLLLALLYGVPCYSMESIPESAVSASDDEDDLPVEIADLWKYYRDTLSRKSQMFSVTVDRSDVDGITLRLRLLDDRCMMLYNRTKKRRMNEERRAALLKNIAKLRRKILTFPL